MVAGDVVNTAARLQADAPINGIIVGEETYQRRAARSITRPATPYGAREAHRSRSGSSLRAATGAGRAALSEAPLVGRERELALLDDIWDAYRRAPCAARHALRPARHRQGRLADEFARLVDAHGGRTLRGRSTPYGDTTAYGAFART